MTKSLNIALVGLGTVGTGVVHLWPELKDRFEAKTGYVPVIKTISARHQNQPRDFNVDAFEWVNDPLTLPARDDIDAIVEVTGGSQGLPLELAKACMHHNKPLVTANKAMVAENIEMLIKGNETPLTWGIEAAVGGGMPVMSMVKNSLSASGIKQCAGILNGTANYILSTMERMGADFSEVLKDAQDKGYAEADPSFDIDGNDAAHKTVLLGLFSFGAILNYHGLAINGIRPVTQQDFTVLKDWGLTIKHLGVMAKDGDSVRAAIGPFIVEQQSQLGQTSGVLNSAQVDTIHAGQMFICGAGAGGNATANAIWADLTDIAQGSNALAYQVDKVKVVEKPEAIKVLSYYVRIPSEKKSELADIQFSNHIERDSVFYGIADSLDKKAKETIIKCQQNEDAWVVPFLPTENKK